MNSDFGRFAMFDGAGNGLLRDPIKMVAGRDCTKTPLVELADNSP
jgi:hypothetical protein